MSGEAVGVGAREVMTLRECALYLQVSPYTMYKYASDGFIPAFKLGNRWRFKRSAVDKWIERQSEKEGT